MASSGLFVFVGCLLAAPAPGGTGAVVVPSETHGIAKASGTPSTAAPCEAAPDGMACVPGGRFIRGADDGPKSARPAATIWLDTFYMDLYEVTHAEYEACRAKGACPRGGPLYNDFSRPRQPIVGVSWFAAVAYCEAAGKHLPTEAQWEKSARGEAGETHPWGNEPATCERAVLMDHRGRSCGVPKRFEHPKKGRTFEVGSKPSGRYGLFDVSGNAWEWVFDWASRDYAACGEACAGPNPKGPCGGASPCKGHERRVVRGGSWYWPASHATGLYRRSHVPENPIRNFHHFGFRCAASVEEARVLRARSVPASTPPAPPAEPARFGPTPAARTPPADKGLMR